MSQLSGLRKVGQLGLLTALFASLCLFATAPVALAGTPSTCVLAVNRDGVVVAEACVNPKYARIHVSDLKADGMKAVGYWNVEPKTFVHDSHTGSCVDDTKAGGGGVFCFPTADGAIARAGYRVCFRAADLANTTAYYLSERACVTLTGNTPYPQ